MTAPRAPHVEQAELRVRGPLAAASLLEFLGGRVVPGLEDLRDGRYRRTLGLPRGHGIVELWAAGDSRVGCALRLADARDRPRAISLCRRLLDLDADPSPAAAHLGSDPIIGPLVRAAPGRRVPGGVDGLEIAVRAVIGQQISVVAARTVLGRLVAVAGAPLALDDPALDQVFPSAEALAAAPDEALPMPGARRRTLRALAEAAGAGLRLDPEADSPELRDRLMALPGVGPWTVSYIALRALGDRDAFLPTDLGVRRALAALGQPDRPAAARRLGERWRPWRSYATVHLLASPGAGAARRMRPPNGEGGI